jgi:hypothetical protein
MEQDEILKEVNSIFKIITSKTKKMKKDEELIFVAGIKGIIDVYLDNEVKKKPENAEIIEKEVLTKKEHYSKLIEKTKQKSSLF